MAEISENHHKSLTISNIILWLLLLFLAEELIRVAIWVAGWKGFWGMFTHGALWYKVGELLIIAPVLIVVFNISRRDRKQAMAFMSRIRRLIWLGAALNLAALVYLAEENWWSPWLPVLVLLGMFIPIVFKSLTARWEVRHVQVLTIILLGLFTFNYATNWSTTGGLVIDLPTPWPREAADRVEQWRQDLRYLATELPRRHANPFFKTPKEDFYEAVQRLDEAIPNLEDHQIFVGMMRLTASLGDPHTNLWPWFGYTFRFYPLGFGWYAEGPFVQAAEEQNRQYIGMRIERIGKYDINTAYRMVSELIPHTGEAILRSTTPDLLCRPEILHALGIIENMDSCTYVLQDSALNEHAVTVYPKYQDSISWAKRLSPVKLWLQNPNTYYWYRVFEGAGLLYFKYNRCLEQYPNEFSVFCSEMFDAVRSKHLRVLVVDFRRNGGGSEKLFADFMANLNQIPSILEHGHLIGIIDRNAGGVAIANAIELQKETGAVFFGEPPDTDGPAWPESGYLDLPNSGGIVYYPEVDPNMYLQKNDSVIVQFRTLPSARPGAKRPILDGTMDSVMSYVRTLTDRETEPQETN